MTAIVGISLCRNEMEHFFIFQAFSWFLFLFLFEMSLPIFFCWIFSQFLEYLHILGRFPLSLQYVFSQFLTCLFDFAYSDIFHVEILDS